MQFNTLIHLPFSDLRLVQYSLSCIEKTVILARLLSLFHSDSTNIDPNANVRTGDDVAKQSAHFTYRSRCDTTRIQILNCCQRHKNGQMEPRSGSKPSANLAGTPHFRVNPWTGPSSPVPYPDGSQVTRDHC
jgi:hypothetical protein